MIAKPAKNPLRLRPLLFAAALLSPVLSFAAPEKTALPQGGAVVAGQASLVRASGADRASLTVSQTTERAVVNWQSFDIGSAAEVRFVQPGASSVTLNRVIGADPSRIFGNLTANGRIYLVNPNGVYFAPGSSVEVGGLLATTADIADGDFMSGRDVFRRGSARGSVVNEGTLLARDGGFIALMAPEVRNAGFIFARGGSVTLAAGDAFALTFDDAKTGVSLAVQPSTVDALVENRRLIRAEGGEIVLSAQAFNAVAAQVVNAGDLDASSIESDGGRIFLGGTKVEHAGSATAASAAGKGGEVKVIAALADPTSVATVTGSIDVAGTQGGFVETSGKSLSVAGATVNVGPGGRWLLDPINVTIDAATAATLATTLNGGGAATVQADQTITVSSALSAGGTGLLTLDAGTSIVMNAAITRSGTGGVTLRVASGGVTGSSNIALTGGGALAFDVGGSGSYSGDISGTGSLVKRGAGEQILYGRGDMTGGTTVQAGTLRLVPGSAEGTNRFRWANGEQTITVNSGAVLVLDASAGNGSNQTYLEAGRSLTLTGSGTVQKIGSFSLEMGWSDRRFIVSLASDGLFQVAQGQVSHNYTRDNWRNNQGVLELFVGTTFNTYSENIYVSGLTGFGLLQNTYAAGGNKAIYITSPSGAANYTFGGTVDWYLWIEKAGAGKQTFSGAQGNFGDYVLRGGTLELNGSNWSLNVTSDVRMDAGTTLNIGGNISIGLLGHNTGTPTDTVVNLSNNATLTMGDGGNSTFAGVIQGQGSIAKTQGSGQQTFTNQLTYSGVTQVNAGTLFLSGAGRLPSGGDLIVNGGLLDLNSFSHSMGKLTGTGGSIQLGSGTLTLNQASNGTYAGNIRGTGGLVKNGTGSLTFTNWSDYTGTTTINAGSLYLNRFDSSSGAGTLNTSRVIVNNGGILDWGVANSFGYLANSGIEAITVNEGGQVGRADNSLQQHMWNNFTVEMTGGRFYVGSNTQVMGLTFTIKAPATPGATSEVLRGGSGDLRLRNDGPSITFDVAQNASALVSVPINTNGTSGTLIKSGLGQLELSSGNTYYGPTIVYAGTLKVSGTQYANAGDGTETTVLTGATYIAANTHKIAYLQGGGNVQILTGFTLTSDDSATTTYSGVMSGGGRFVKAGSGELTLSGANTFTGGFTLENGTVWLNSAGGPAIATNITLGNNTTAQSNLRMMRDNQFADGLVLTTGNAIGNWTHLDLRGTNQSLKQIISGSSTTQGSLVLQNIGLDGSVVSGRSQGTLTLTGNGDSILNAYVRDRNDNGTTNSLKIVKQGSGDLLFLQTSTTDDGVNFTGGLDVQGGTVTVGNGSYHGRIGSAPVSLAAGTTLTYFRSTNPYSIANNWSGSGTVILKGTGANGQSSFTYTGTNALTAAGTVVVDKARFDVSTGGTLGNASTIDVRTGGQLFFSGAASGTFSAPIRLAGSGWREPDGSQMGAIRHSSSNLVTLSGPITLANDARIHTSGAGHLAISGVIDDGVNSFGLEKTGYYGLTLTGANTYGGDTVIRGGRLLLNNASGPALYNGTTGTVRINNDNSTGSYSAGSHFVGLQTLRDDQLGSNVNVWFDGTSYSAGFFNEFSLNGTSQTIGNLFDQGGHYRNVIQHQNTSNNQSGTLTVTQTTHANYTGSFRRSYNGSGSVLNLVKNGGAALVFKTSSSHTNHLQGGTLTVNAGEFVYNIDDDPSANGNTTLGLTKVTVNAGSTFTYVNDMSLTVTPELAGQGIVQLRGINTINVGDFDLTRANPSFSGEMRLGDNARLKLGTAAGLGTATLDVSSGSGVYVYTTTAITTALSIAGQGWNEGAGRLGALRLANGASWAGTVALTADADVGVYGSSESASITGVISGAATSRLWKTWSGTLTLSGLNTYAGGTGIAQGVLAVSSVANAGAPSALGASTADAANLLFNGGSLRYTGSAAATSNRGFSIGAGGSATIDLPSGSLTFSGGTPTTTGSLSKSGSGTLALAGATLLSGSITVSAGDLEILPGGNLGGGAYAGAISLGNGSTLRYKAGGTQSLSGAISGTGGNLLIDGANSAVTLSGNNTYTGRTDILAGTLKITGGTSQTTTMNIASGSVLEFDTGATSWTGGGTDGNLTGSQRGFWTGGAGVNWTGGGTIIKKGSATLGLSTDDADTWALSAGSLIDVREGRVYFGWGWNDTSTNNKVDVQVAAGTTFDLWDLPQYRIRNLTGSGTVTGASYANATLPTLVVGENNATSTFAGTVTNLVGGITKVGTGTFTLDAAINHGFRGSLTVSAGTFSVLSSAQFNSGTLTGAVSVAAGSTLRFASSSPQALAGVVSGAGTLIVEGAGLVSLQNNNSFTGQTIVRNNASLRIGNASGSTGYIFGDISVASGSLVTFYRNGSNEAVENTFSGAGRVEFTSPGGSGVGGYYLDNASPSFTGTAVAKAQVRLNVPDPQAFGTGVIRVESTGQLFLDGSLGRYATRSLTNLVYLAGNGWLEGAGQLGAMRIDNGADFAGSAVLTGNTRFGIWGDTGRGILSGTISEEGGSFYFQKWGPGRLTLSGANTYTGKTYVSDGILKLANPSGPALYAGAGGGEVVIGHDVNSTNWVFPNVWAQLEFGASNQMGADVDVTFDTANPFAYFTLRGTTQTIGNISTGRNPNWAVLQNVESAAHDTGIGAATLIINQRTDLTYSGYLRDAWRASNGVDSNSTPTSGGTKPSLRIEKYGTGRLTITTDTYNTGGLAIYQGVLQIGAGAGVGSLDARNTVTLGRDGSLEYFRNNDVSINHDITGDGNVTFRGTGLSGQSHYDYNGVNSISRDATITVDKARLRVDAQANIGTNNPWVIVKQGGQLWFPSSPTIGSRIRLEGEGWLEAAATNKGVNGLGALRLDNNGTLQLNGEIVLTGNARIGMWSTNANVSIASTISESGGSFGLEFRAFNPSTTDSTASLVTLTGSSSYTGYTNLISGRLRLANPSGRALYTNTAATSSISIISQVNGADAFLEFGANNQLGANVNLVFDSRSTGWAETNIMGTTQVIGNILLGGNTNNWRANIQNHWNLDTFANGTLTITQTQDVSFTGNVRDKAGTPGTSKLNIVKAGPATLRLLNTTNPSFYGGSTTVNDGTLAFDFFTNGSGNVSPRTSGITLNADSVAGTRGVLEFNVGSGTADLAFDLSFSGNGTLLKTGAGTLRWPQSAATFALTPGGLIKVAAGDFTAGSYANETWTNNKASLEISAGATFSSVEADVVVDALLGAGTWNAGYSGLSSSPTVGVADGSGTFSGVIKDLNAGAGHVVKNLIKVGSGTQVLSGANTYSGVTQVNAGTLRIGAGGTTGALGSSSTEVRLQGGTLVFDLSAAYSVSQKIVGDGSVGALVQAGSGTTTLTSNLNTYRPATLVSAGKLVFAGSQTATASVDIASGATLELAASLATFSHPSGITYTGAGTLARNAASGSSVSYLYGPNGGTIRMSKDGLIRVLAGELRLDNGASSRWKAADGSWVNQASLEILSGAKLDFYTNATDVYVDALLGAGSIVRTGSSASGGFFMGSAGGGGTFSGSIDDGAGGIVIHKIGTGTQVLAGASVADGATFVEAGTLRLTGTLGDASAVTVSADAIYDARATDTIGSLAGAVGSKVLLASGVTLSSGGLDTDTVMAGIVDGAGGLTKLGTGVLELSAANTFTGAATASGGTLRVSGTLADRVAVSVLNTGRYEALATDTIGSLAGSADSTVLLANGKTLTTGFLGTDTVYAGTISGQGALVKIGAGTFSLSGANVYSGGTTIEEGVLRLGAGAGSAAGSVVGDIVNDASLSFARSNQYAFTGVISGTGSVSQDGTGETVLSAAQTYLGDTLVRAGTLTLTTGTLADVSGVTVDNGATYDVRVTDTIRLLQGAGSVVLSSGVILSAGDGTNTVYGGAMSGAGGFRKTGSGQQTFSGANTYVGATSVAAGTLVVSGSLADTTSVTLLSGTAYRAAASDTIGSLSGAGGSTLVLVAGATLRMGGTNATTTMAGLVIGQGSLSKEGSGVFTLSSDATYTGATTVLGGTLTVTGTLSDATAVSVSSGAGYRVAASDTIGSLAGASGSVVQIDAGKVLTAGASGASSEMAGVIQGQGSFAKSGTGTLTLSGANVYGGSTTVEAGLLRLGADEAIPDASLLTVASGAEFFLNGHTETVHRVAGTGKIHLASELILGGDNSSFELTPEVYGTGTFTKAGTGTLTIRGSVALSSAGLVQVQGGALAVGAGSATGDLGSAQVTLAAGTSLTVNRAGSFAFDNLVSGQGYLSLTASGALAINKAVTLSAGSSGNDGRASIVAGGVLTLASGANLSAAGSDPSAGMGALNLVVGGFANNGGTLQAPGGRWLLWSVDPTTDVVGTLGHDFKQYDAAYGSTVLGTGNGLIYSASPVMGPVSFTGTFTKTYDGLVTATVNGSPIRTEWFDFSAANLVSGDQVSGLALQSGATSTFASKDAGARQVTLDGIGFQTIDAAGKPVYGYRFSQGRTFTGNGIIEPKALTFAGLAVADKVYDGLLTATVTSSGVLAGFVPGERVDYSLAPATFDVADVGARTATVPATLRDAYDLVGGTPVLAGLASNYVLPLAQVQKVAQITPAALVITAVADAKFVTKADRAGYAGVRYAGFVNGETDTVLTTPATVSRDLAPGLYGAGGPESAGSHAGTLVPSGATASNYAITFVRGDYTITPADSLLVRINAAPTVYGSSPVYSASAQYLFPGDTNPTNVAVSVVGNIATVTDGSNATSTFTIVPLAPAYSGAGSLRVGSYALAPSGLVASGNFQPNLALTGSLAVSPRVLQVSATGAGKVYDGTTQTAPGASFVIQNKLGGDVLDVSGQLAFLDKNAGLGKTLTLNGVTLSGADSANYSFVTAGTADIAKKSLGSVYSVQQKTYDGTANAVVAADLVAAGQVAGDVLTVSNVSALFDSSHVSTQLDGQGAVLAAGATQVAISGIALGGTDAGNYTVSPTQTIAATIARRQVAINSFSSADKTYDGGVTAGTTNYGTSLVAVSGVADSGLVAGESIAFVPGIATFADADAALGKLVTGSGLLGDGSRTLNGPDLLPGTADDIVLRFFASDYQFVNPTARAAITPKQISASFSLGAKTYDGTTQAVVASSQLSGLVGSETLDVRGASAAFAVADAGAGRAFTVGGYVLADATGKASNYVLANSSFNGTADVAKRGLTGIVGLAASNKVYDGTTAATADWSAASLTGVLPVDSVEIGSLSMAFSQKDVGIRALTVTGVTLAGASAANYYVVASPTIPALTAEITPATITQIVGLAAANKTYDGTTNAQVSPSSVTFQGVFAGDQLDIAPGYVGAFETANAGNNRIVRFSGLALGGPDAGNYRLSGSTVAQSTANISPREITSVSGITLGARSYDGTTAGTPDYSAISFVGLVNGESLRLTGGSGAYADANVAYAAGVVSAKSGSASGYSLQDGATGLASNYVLGSGAVSSVATGLITPRQVTSVSGLRALDKVYDRTVAAQLDATAATFDGLLAGEAINLSGSQAVFADANAGVGKAVTLGSLVINQGNYVLAGNVVVAPITATILPATITAVSGLAGVDRVYDGTTAAGLNLGAGQYAGLLAGDSLTLSAYSAEFASASAGLREVAVGSATLGGASAANYVLAPAATFAVTPATIARRTLTTVDGAVSANKTYDGTANASISVTGITLGGILAGDSVAAAEATGSFANKFVGTGKTVSIDSLSLVGPASGNYQFVAGATVVGQIQADISARTISSVTGVKALDKVYDGQTAAGLDFSEVGFVGLVPGDALAIVPTGYVAAFASRNVGTHDVSISGLAITGADAANYVLDAAASGGSARASISPRSLVMAGVQALDKAYDGQTAAVVTLANVDWAALGLVSGDDLTVTPAAIFRGKNVVRDGSGVVLAQPVVISYAFGGADVGNYAVTPQALASAKITPLAIASVTGIAAADKVYDGGLSAQLTLTGAILAGMLPGDDLGVSNAQGSFIDKNVGVAKTVQIGSLVLGGADAVNYDLTTASSAATATITPRVVSAVEGLTVVSRAYDGSVAATLDASGASFAGKVGGDVLTLTTWSASYADANASIGKPVAVSNLSLGGADAGNYQLASTTTSLLGNITRRAITSVAGLSAQDRTYDGTTAASLVTSAPAFAGLLPGDDLSIAAYQADFDSRHVGLRAVTVGGMTLGGASAANYELTQGATYGSLSANITPATITGVSGLAVSDKVYDGGTQADVSASFASLVGRFGADQVSLASGLTAAFADKNVGTAKNVVIGNVALVGADAADYVLQPGLTVTATASITPRSLVVSGVTAASKTYDGTAAVAVSTLGVDFVRLGAVAGDDLGLTASGAFADKNVQLDIVGNPVAKPVTLAISVIGQDAANYSFTLQPTATAVISPATIAAVGGLVAADKSYDGNTTAAIDASAAVLPGRFGSDDVSVLSAVGAFADKNVGVAKAVTISGIVLGGADASNYVLGTSVASASATISQASLVVRGVTGVTRPYDGTTSLPGSSSYGSVQGLVSGDSVNVVGTAAFASPDAGSVGVVRGSVAISGADAANYRMVWQDGAGVITKRALTVTANDDAYFVTQTFASNFNGVSYAGFIPGESAASLGGSLTVTKSSPGSNLPGSYQLTPGGLVSNNYDFTYVPGGLTILPANRLLVKTSNEVVEYGSVISLNPTAVQYMSPSGTIYDLSRTSYNSGQYSYTYTDGLGGQFTFRIGASGPVSSTGNLVPGNYDITATSFAQVGRNLADSPDEPVIFIGKLTVTPRVLSAYAEGVAKVYDGLTAMPSAVLKLDRGLSGDSLVLGGNAAYVSRSAGTGVAYSLTNLALSGSDAGCYLLTSSSLIAHDGVIAPRPLSLSGIQAVSKAYDGNTSATLDLTNVVFSGQVFGDTLSVTGATGMFADKNVGSGKGVAISSLSLAGADAGNYTFAPGSQASTADITQLASVQWVGGATGNWFDPANWAGGAVPDLANVRDVIIPAGSSVSFGAPAVAPAQFGPVSLASLSGAGSLILDDGALSIGSGGLALGGLDVTGGDLVSQGPATIGSYLQSGGIVNMMTDLTVTASFNKTGGQLNVFGDLSIVSSPGATLDGLIFVQGNLDLISSNGPLSLGSVTVGGDLGVTTNGGAITQTGPLDVTGTTGLNAGGGDITLSNPGNLFGGAVTLTGGDVIIATSAEVTLGDVTATGGLKFKSNYPIKKTPGAAFTVTGPVQLGNGDGINNPGLTFNYPDTGTSIGDVITRSAGVVTVPSVDMLAEASSQMAQNGTILSEAIEKGLRIWNPSTDLVAAGDDQILLVSVRPIVPASPDILPAGDTFALNKSALSLAKEFDISFDILTQMDFSVVSLEHGEVAGLVFSFDPANGRLTLKGTSTAEAVEKALRSIRFKFLKPERPEEIKVRLNLKANGGIDTSRVVTLRDKQGK